MTNFEKLIGQITPAILAEWLECDDLSFFRLCATCAKDNGVDRFCCPIGERMCPFVKEPGLILDFLNEEAEGFSFKEFLDRKLKKENA